MERIDWTHIAITIHRSPTTKEWVAVYSGAEADKVRRLSGGTLTFPLGFDSTVSADVVLATVRNRNPNSDVRLSVPTPQVPRK